MANRCTRSLKVCASKITKIAADGSPVVGASSSYVFGDLVTLNVTSEYSDDDDLEVRGASGDICARYFAFGPLKNLTFELEGCSVDAERDSLLIGETPLTSGAATGFRWPEIGSGLGCAGGSYHGVGLEVWTLNVASDGSPDPTFPYWRWLFPRTYWKIGDKNFANEFMAPKFSGYGNQNPQWLDGPSNDWPVASDRVGQALEVATAPTPGCGYVAVAST